MATLAAVATTVATLTVMATTTVRGAVAAVTSRRAAAIAAAATMTTEQASRCRLFAAHQGQSDDREKNRDPENQCAIHLNPPTGIPERTGP
jgi:hypothetical protein